MENEEEYKVPIYRDLIWNPERQMIINNSFVVNNGILWLKDSQHMNIKNLWYLVIFKGYTEKSITGLINPYLYLARESILRTLDTGEHRNRQQEWGLNTS